jgi:ribosomal protein S18 acetylase RimI-like enzyme
MRDVEDVMQGHRAIGVFREDLWTLVMVAGKPAGCLLLAHTPARDAVDVVYLGLAPAARGRGLGRLLMRQALRAAAECHAATLSLAVDESNTPALKLYRRFGLAAVARRVALVAQVTPASAGKAGAPAGAPCA